jgi:hypothetical protein
VPAQPHSVASPIRRIEDYPVPDGPAICESLRLLDTSPILENARYCVDVPGSIDGPPGGKKARLFPVLGIRRAKHAIKAKDSRRTAI